MGPCLRRLLGIGYVLAVLMLAGVGCIRAAAPAPGGEVFYVSNHGRHTGIILRRRDLAPGLGWPPLPRFGDEEWLEFGWGSEGFYMARSLSVGLVLETVFTSTPSVLHVVGFRGRPELAFARTEMLRLRCSRAEFRALCRGIAGTFSRDGRGGAVALGPGLYGHSQFYRANGRYSLPANCNVWTARRLRAGGFPVHGPATLTAGGVAAQLRPLAVEKP